MCISSTPNVCLRRLLDANRPIRALISQGKWVVLRCPNMVQERNCDRGLAEAVDTTCDILSLLYHARALAPMKVVMLFCANSVFRRMIMRNRACAPKWVSLYARGTVASWNRADFVLESPYEHRYN